ncbi:MAG: efflux RND transporter periplasmic adaptor subunit [Elstera sp.]
MTRLLPPSLLLLAFGLTAFGVHAQEAAGPKPPMVSVVAAEQRAITARVTVTGSIVAREEVLVSPEIDNLRILEILVEEGDVVQKGQVLARLSRETLETEVTQLEAAQARLNAAIAQARSQITQAEASRVEATAALQRSQSLRQTGNASQEQLDQRTATARTAQARLNSAQEGVRLAEAQRAEMDAQIRDARIRLGRTEVKAPAAGIISRRTAKLGAQTSAGAEPLFRIIADGALDVSGDVPESRFAQVKLGQSADIQLPDGQTVTGTVRLLAPMVNSSTRLGSVRIALPLAAPALMGNFARGTIVVDQKTALVAPTAALLFGSGKTTLQVAKDGRVETRPVTVGIRAGGLSEITGGLTEGEWIIAKAGTFLRNGDRIRPQQAALDAVLTGLGDATPLGAGN